jgi:localization factor PodJL
MNSRVSWSVEGIEPSVRERAEAAARRAGMTLNDWLNSTIGDTAPSFRRSADPRAQLPSQDAKNVAEIHQRLDSITQQIEQISAPSARTEPPLVARQLNDAISRLDARLSQMNGAAPAAARQPPPPAETPRRSALAERAAMPAYTASPSISPTSLDSAIAEIAARQSELDGIAPPTSRRSPAPVAPPPAAPAPAPAPAPAAPAPAHSPEFSRIERQLLKINTQIETLRRPDGIEQSITAFRGELAEIRNVITEAVPRRAIESIENDIRSLSQRIDDTRQSGMDGQALAGVERALGEIRDTLRSLMPAEQLAGFDEAIRNLGGKIDLIVRSSDDPDTLQQLEGAITALRAIVANVASNDTLGRLSDDVRVLSSRVDQLAQSGGDSFAALERRIAELTTTLENRERPAAEDRSEHLEGALRALSDRLDHLPDNNRSSEAFAHIEGAVRALSDRFDQLPAGNHSSEAFTNIEGAVRALHDRLDRLPATGDGSAAFAHIEGGLRALNDRFDRLPANTDSSAAFDHLAAAVGALSDRIDHLSVGQDNSAALAHLEQRVSYLLERLEKSALDPNAGNFGRVEQGLQEILRHLERQQSSFASLANPGKSGAVPIDSEMVETIKRELSEMRFTQTETDRHTQDSLEVVHNTLGHVVDRLAMIEGDLRTARPGPAAAVATMPQVAAPPAAPRTPTLVQPAAPSQPRPELPNPAASQFVAAPRQFGVPPDEPAATAIPKTISDILDSHGTQDARAVPAGETRLQPSRSVIDPELPPDHPLEPGTRPPGRIATPSERIAASEHALSEISAGPREPASTSNFIAAARRAAQAAAAVPANAKPSRGSKPGRSQTGPAQASSNISSKIRAFLVAASVVVIVLSSFKMAMTLLEGGPPPQKETAKEVSKEVSSEAPPAAPAESDSKPLAPAAVMPSLTSPTPIGRQPLSAPLAVPPASNNAPAAPPATDVTGTLASPQASAAPIILPAGPHKLAQVPIPAGERLPDAIGGAALRNAALKGDASAAYEIGVRYAEGKGVAANFDEAAKWYDRAAQAGVVPAIFRLGTLYEKGVGMKKDLDAARRYYVQAAERGNAKAMHNLAVLDADGGGKGADYGSAAQWFRKAAERGVADSQFNLGILYARGIGVEQNLAESFKWFSLAAAQGDADAGRKRDDVAKRLDAQSLAAATLAIQTFVAEGQPDDAINVASPPGGWDGVPATAAKTAAKPALTRRTAAAH